MMMMSYVSPRLRPDVPATFESLNDDTLGLILKFVGDKSYATYARINKRCKEVYLASGMAKETFVFGYAPLSVIIGRYVDDPSCSFEVSEGVVVYNRLDVLDWALQEYDENLLKSICFVAAVDGRIGLLNEVWNDIEDDDKECIFGGIDCAAANGGKLNVFKWIEEKELPIDKEDCASQAAFHGQTHFLQWLQEEKSLQLSEGLYNKAIRGGHINVLKWLREQEVPSPWDEYTFQHAALKGNLEVLQWLHDEGCPWDPSNSVYKGYVDSEAQEWLRTNGYGNRLY